MEDEKEKEKEKEKRELQKVVKDLFDLQADYYIQKDKCDKYINAIDKILGIEHTPVNDLIKKRDNDIYKQLSYNEVNVINHARKILDLNIKDDITVVFGRKEQYTVRVLLEIIDQLLEQSCTKNELIKKGECTEQQWNNCRVEKMGCKGCMYDDYSGKNESPKMRPINYPKNSKEE